MKRTIDKEQLQALGMDTKLGGDRELQSISFRWEPDSEDGQMVFSLRLRGKLDVSEEVAEHEVVESLRRFETALALAGVLERMGSTELFNSESDAEMRMFGRTVHLPKGWILK